MMKQPRMIVSLTLLFLAFLATSSCSTDEEIKVVSFDRSCGAKKIGRFLQRSECDAATYKCYRELWEKNNPKKREKSSIVLIPAVIHQIWLYPGPIPPRIRHYMKSVKKQHSSWKYTLWYQQTLDSEFPELKPLLQKCATYKEKEALAASFILEREGGVVLAPACQSFLSLEPFNFRYDFYVGLEPPRPKQKEGRSLYLGLSVLGAHQGQPIVSLWKEKMQQSLTNDQVFDPAVLLGDAFSATLCSAKSSSKEIVFPPTYFYPVRPHWMKTYERHVKNGESLHKRILYFLQFEERPLFSETQQETCIIDHGIKLKTKKDERMKSSTKQDSLVKHQQGRF